MTLVFALQQTIVFHLFEVFGSSYNLKNEKFQRGQSDANDNNRKMTRFYKQTRRMLPYIINEKDTVNTRISMKVAMKCFRDFLTESEMSANCKDSPVEYVILLWCKENIWGFFQEKCCVGPTVIQNQMGMYAVGLLNFRPHF